VESPVPRLPPMAGPPPTPIVRKVGYRKRGAGEPPDDPRGEPGRKRPPEPHGEPEDRSVAPPAPDETGSRLDLTA
jgi:hypothetical protein